MRILILRFEETKITPPQEVPPQWEQHDFVALAVDYREGLNSVDVGRVVYVFYKDGVVDAYLVEFLNGNGKEILLTPKQLMPVPRDRLGVVNAVKKRTPSRLDPLNEGFDFGF